MTSIFYAAVSTAVILLCLAFLIDGTWTDFASWVRAHRRRHVSERDLMVDLTGRMKGRS